MEKKDLQDILDGFAKNNIIFSREIPFQCALAIELRNQGYNVYLEDAAKDSAGERYYIDIVAEKNGKVYGIELKYKTLNKDIIYKDFRGNDVAGTFNQGAKNNGSVAFWEDVVRLEGYKSGSIQICVQPKSKPDKCFAILLSNHSGYWNGVNGSLYEDFFPVNGKCFNGQIYHKAKLDKNGKILDGRSKSYDQKIVVNSTRTFTNAKGNTITISPITISGTYKCDWKPYIHTLKPYSGGKLINNEFKYLILEINDEQ